jgi:DNA-binding response OmpR family regulator
MFLELSGYEVYRAYDGEEALRQAERHRPEIVLLDIGLPKLDGYEVARRLRASGGPELIIAITGYGRDEDRNRGMEAGFDRYLVKPVDPTVLLRELAAAQPS